MIAALVCGRAESQPFPGRNTFPLLGRPLMVYPVLAALHAEGVTRTFLTTDDAAMARIARHSGAEVIERPPELAGTGVALTDVLRHGYEEIRARVGAELEALVVLVANAATVTSDLIDQGIERLRTDRGIDAVMTAARRSEFSPHVALRLSAGGRLRPYASLRSARPADVYFADALFWILRPAVYFGPRSVLSPMIVDTARQRVAALVHEGYGDVDYVWQVPAVEEWLRRRGFTEQATPYAAATPAVAFQPPARRAPRVKLPAVERRVLVTTVPFGKIDRRPLDLLEAHGIEYVVNPIGRRLTEDELAKMIGRFGVVIAGTEPITNRVLAAAPRLRLISRVGVGLDSVDLAAARSRGIHVTYTPDAPSPAVAEMTVGLMLALLRHIPGADRNMRNGVWHRVTGRRLSETTVGVLGVGRIGRRVIQHLRGGFPGVRIVANDIDPDRAFGEAHGVEWVDKSTLYRTADVITLHLPLTPATRRLIGVREFALMRPTTVLVNTSRGEMIAEHGLAEALRAGQIAGAAVDVFEREPYSGELATVEGCILTCHMGSMSEDCRSRMELEATEEVIRFIADEPLCHPAPEAEYGLQGAVA